ncbi:hypothetical protein [Nocardia wallacei]|uniref:hypothetical protein n=1 Tax=Nocardia wallacei TaxID=480035 RepID=UPI0024555499|nr:hypothetical protein [Nocardia wallacei]
MKTLGQAATLWLWLGAWIALMVGVVMLVPGATMLLRDPQAAPACDETPTTPGTTCHYYRDGDPVGGKTYQQASAEQRGSHEDGTQLLLIGAAVIVAGSTLLLGVKYAWSSGDPKSASGGDRVAMNNPARPPRTPSRDCAEISVGES